MLHIFERLEKIEAKLEALGADPELGPKSEAIAGKVNEIVDMVNNLRTVIGEQITLNKETVEQVNTLLSRMASLEQQFVERVSESLKAVQEQADRQAELLKALGAQ